MNLGTIERTSVLDAVKEVMAYTGHDAEIELHPEMPTGPMNRVADNRLAKELLDWEPQVPFVDGLHRDDRLVLRDEGPRRRCRTVRDRPHRALTRGWASAGFVSSSSTSTSIPIARRRASC